MLLDALAVGDIYWVRAGDAGAGFGGVSSEIARCWIS